MTTYTAYTTAFIEREIDRYSTWPAQATTYMIGKLKIRELRDKAQERLCMYKFFINVYLYMYQLLSKAIRSRYTFINVKFTFTKV